MHLNRTLLLNKREELYLEKCAQEHKFSYGIIVGHQAELNKYIAVHLARNNEEDGDLEDLADVRLTINDINPQTLASQWLSASKMCPGSFDVIGLFVSSVRSEVIDENSAEAKNAKKLFSDVYDILLRSSNTFGVYTTDVAETDYVFMAYSLSDKKMVCRNYSYGNGGTFSPMEYRFIEKPFEWIQLECSYDLDDVIPVHEPDRRINIEEQFQHVIVAVRKNLIASEVFLQNETVDDTLELQAYIKKKKNRGDKQKASNSTAGSTVSNSNGARLDLLSSNLDASGGINNVIRASILLPVRCQLDKNSEIRVREFNGTMRMSGIIFSRIFCNPHNSIADVKRFLRDDVLRSLITRIQVYCDGLTDPHVTNEALYISEPPRRVFFNLHEPTLVTATGSSNSNTTPVQFSEYLFRGEAPTVVVSQAKQILDLELNPDLIALHLEGLPDDTNFTNVNANSDQTDNPGGTGGGVQKRELSRNLYMLGIAVALLVLLMSAALHYALGQP